MAKAKKSPVYTSVPLLLSDLEWNESMLARWKRSAQTWAGFGDCKEDEARAKKQVRAYHAKITWTKQRLLTRGVQV